jgi:hypothetical protein
MEARYLFLTQCMLLVLAFALCGMPELLQAQDAASPQQSPQMGTTVDPSKGPLQPIPTQTLPDTPSAERPAPDNDMTQNPQTATPPPQTRMEPQQEPLGAATAEGVPTVGGGASRPAGAAIAPAKQNQKRSLLIKMGAIAAVGVAAGTIYGISKGTSAKPSGQPAAR